MLRVSFSCDAIVPVMRSDVLSICTFPLLVLHFSRYSRLRFGIMLRSCFMLVLSLMLD